MHIETFDGNVKLTAEEGGAIHRKGTPTPSHTVGVTFPVGKDDAANWEDCELGEPKGDEVMKYSVRSIIREMRALGRYDAFRTFLETAKLDWDFVGANYLADGDADFDAMKVAIVSQGILTQTELDEMLPKCVWVAD